MSQRTEYLRQHALTHPAPGLRSAETDYLWLRAFTNNRIPSNLQRRAIARAESLRLATPVIDEYELIVGKPCFNRIFTPSEQAEYDALRAYAAPAMTRLDGQASHMAIDYEKILRLGLSGIRAEITAARAKLKLAPDPSESSAHDAITSETAPELDRAEATHLARELRRDDFYAAALIALDGLRDYAKHYSEYAAKLAADCADPARRAELERIAATLLYTPENPPRNFYEAVQCVQFVTFPLEGLYELGRPDRYLRRFYEADLAAGTLTRADALEYITCLCILFNEYIPRGLAVGLMVCGRGPDGCDATCELSYLFLESIALTRMIYPSVNVCADSDTPREILDLSCELLSHGYSHPAIFGDDVISWGLRYYGLPPEHACEYIHSTCVEITPCARSAVWVASPYHNLPGYLLEALSRPDIDEAAPDWPSLERLYRQILAIHVRDAALDQNRAQLERARHGGDPLVSCFVDDCIARGQDIDMGGALYNWIMPSFVGMSNLVDSFAVIRELVFSRRELTLSELYNATRSDFKGREELRREIAALPKYGNDNDEVDALAVDVTGWITAEVARYTTYRGDRFIPSLFCWVMHNEFGRSTPATPDGRPSGFPLGDGSGPAQGRELLGPTASVLSSTKWEHFPFIGGIAVNLKFSKSMLTPDSLPKLRALVETYLERGGFEVQINVVDSDTLRDAQTHPEKYSDLVVRIGGYSDYFTAVGKSMQDEIILRTEHSI
jgi:Pyruvate-formate lyase